MGALEVGAGVCCATALLSVRPTASVVELGALGDVMHAVLNAAHHANRHGPGNDRIAVALPGLHIHRGRARPGQEVVLFGSEEALSRFMSVEGVGTLRRRGMLAPLETLPTVLSPGEAGIAFMRDRSVARQSAGARRRAAARTQRLGGIPRPPDEIREPDRSILALHFGPAVVHMRVLAARVTGEPLLVSTYGFSSTQSPAALPIALDSPP